MKTKIKYLKPISKARFDKMSPAKQRVSIATDVIARIKARQLFAEQGKFVDMDNININDKTDKKADLKTFFENKNNTCEVCAKGALFVCHTAIVNDFKVADFSKRDGSFEKVQAGFKLNSKEMKRLEPIFGKKQLTLIETAFEGSTMNHNIKITAPELAGCLVIYNRRDDDSKRLTAICGNIIKNKGEFLLPKATKSQIESAKYDLND